MGDSASLTRNPEFAAYHTPVYKNLVNRLRTSSWVGPIWWVPRLYLIIALPVSILLCFLVPPMQTPDDGRHFLRACQIAQGHILPQVSPTGSTAGGWLPAAAVDFVRDKMNPEFFRREDQLRSIGARLKALDREARKQKPLAQKEFGVFPGSAIYPPALYLPQAIAIRLACIFTNKVYIWFYSARIVNAAVSILLIFLALRLASQYRLVLLIPAILPMSLYQISSLSCDAGIIAVSILFVALSLVFLQSGGWALRTALVVCLVFLTLAKPVYLPFAFLLLASYKRIGWGRSFLFFATAATLAAAGYAVWSSLVAPILPMSSADFVNRNPDLQWHFVFQHPFQLMAIVLRTVKHNFGLFFVELTGLFGWLSLPLPTWFYKMTHWFFAAILLLIFLTAKRWNPCKFVCGILASALSSVGIFIALFVLATPVNSPFVTGVQGRYFIPILAILSYFTLAWEKLSRFLKVVLAVTVLGFFALSAFTTVRIVKHYYFPQSSLLGRNVDQLFTRIDDRSCPAWPETIYSYGFFSTTITGRTDALGDYKVVVANENGTILGVSDPVLAGADFPFNLLPGSSGHIWRVHIWNPNRYAILHYWLIRDKLRCELSSKFAIRPYYVPEA